MKISDTASKKVNEAILITGSARSGTTILGKLIHSFREVEYTFEPPTLFSLIASIGKIDESSFKLLYETYLYEEFFVNALAGRSLNCNKADDSSIYNVKSIQEVESRLQNSMGKIEAEKRTANLSIAYKMPDIVPFIPQLIEYYPGTRLIFTRRSAPETLNSLLQKKWFAPESNNENLILPFEQYADVNVPFWVLEKDYHDWVGMNELDRCAYYYIRVNSGLDSVKCTADIRYSELIADPVGIAHELADKLGVTFGPRTQDILESISPTKKDRDLGIVNGIRPDLQELVKYYSSLS